MALLLERGAKLPRRVSLLGGEFPVSPLELAIFQRDLPMVGLLIGRGADVNELTEAGRVAPDAGDADQRRRGGEGADLRPAPM